MEQIDSLIFPRWIIPVVPAGKRLLDHALAIRAGKIVALCPRQEAESRFLAKENIALPNHVLIPGFVNAHTHAAMTLLRGIADDLPLMEWLNEHIWPRELRWVDEHFVRVGTRLAVAEMLRCGTTCFNDMYFHPDVAAATVREIGIRAALGLIFVDFPTPWATSPEEYFEKNTHLLQSMPADDHITWLLAPHAPYSVSNDMFEQIGDLSARHKLKIHLHLHETQAEINESLDRYQQRPLARLKQIGLVNDRLIAVHMVHCDEDELTVMANSGAGIVHCPQSNMKLASGFAPVKQFLDASISLALGTDGAASNNDLDMLGEMRTAALLAKGVAGDPEVLTAEQALAMATIEGARVIGLDSVIGSLEPGKWADLVAIDLSAPETQPVYDPVAQIIYAADRQQISDVWVGGKHLLADRQLTTIDWPSLAGEVADWQIKLSQPL